MSDKFSSDYINQSKHSIKNSTDTLENRGNLKFTGNVTITDDIANNNTIINIPNADLSGYVPTTRKIGIKLLSADISLDKTDVGLGDVTNDAQVKKISSSVDNNLMSWSGTTGDTPKDSGIASSKVVTTDGTQTLTNKTLTSPSIPSIVNGTYTLTMPSKTGMVAVTSDIPTIPTQSGNTNKLLTTDGTNMSWYAGLYANSSEVYPASSSYTFGRYTNPWSVLYANTLASGNGGLTLNSNGSAGSLQINSITRFNWGNNYFTPLYGSTYNASAGVPWEITYTKGIESGTSNSGINITSSGYGSTSINTTNIPSGTTQILKTPNASGTIALVETLIDKIYPVGHILMTENSANPSTYLNVGTWVAYGAGKVPVGIDTTQTEFNTIGKTGGEKTHVLTQSELPSHDHADGSYNKLLKIDGTATANTVDNTGSEPNLWNTGTLQSVGSNQPHNNLQPYIVCYMFKRIA